jgi:hypothetical protein
MKNFVKLFGNLNQARSAKVPLLIIAFVAIIGFTMAACSKSGGGSGGGGSGKGGIPNGTYVHSESGLTMTIKGNTITHSMGGTVVMEQTFTVNDNGTLDVTTDGKTAGGIKYTVDGKNLTYDGTPFVKK